MSYEYKDEIIMNLKDYNAGRKVTGGTSSFESKLSELDHVYTQATKADEYEAKAKAFDRIREAMDYHYPSAHDRKYLNGYQHPKASLKDIDAIINSYESGEYDD